MNKIIVLLILSLFVQCYYSKLLTKTERNEIDSRYFSIRCMHDSCWQLINIEIRHKIISRINTLYQENKIGYKNIDSIIKTDGKYYSVRLYADGLNKINCDSLMQKCWDSLPEPFHTGYVGTPDPPCIINGCFINAILDSGLNLIHYSELKNKN